MKTKEVTVKKAESETADQPVKLLLVDDREENLLSLEVVLADKNYQLIKAHSGREALKILLQEQDFALILMDVQMPIMDGFETAELIRQSERLKHVPIIFLTANNNAPDNIFKGYQAGAVDYILKPFSIQILQAKVSVFVELYNKTREVRIQSEHLQKVNEQMAQHAEELIRINQELESFSYSVSHDLRAPLRAISGFARLLKEGYNDKLDDEGKRILGIIANNGVKMGKLIDDLLAFSRLGRKELEKKHVDMNELLSNVLVDIEKTVKHNAEISIEELPPAKTEETLMHQVLCNLVTNAIKYSSKKEKPVVQVGYFTDKKEGNVYFVKDNGVGFDMNYYDKLFGVFQRLHSAEDFEGTGIGLAIVHRIISKHGGKIWAEGKADEGATFYFTTGK
jgi:two-component system, sensor histidine kinase and response regulator